jgi:hypothetical protein
MGSRRKQCMMMMSTMCIVSSFFTLPAHAADELSPQLRERSWSVTERLVSLLQQKEWSEEVYQKIIGSIDRLQNASTSNASTTAILAHIRDALTALYNKRHNTEYRIAGETFRSQYGSGMLTTYDTPVGLRKCFDHYAVVDGFAQRVGKPTPLLMAMRYIESSCAMRNPDNRDGIFQIINNDYEPGTIGL